jgi:poly-gamma-glutamate synthesis protein (capsule biosynthesis protein)
MKILITGDFCPINRADIKELNSNNILCQKFKELLSQTDYNITNLESPLTEHSKKIKKTGPALKAPPENVNLLTDLGFNIVTLANNHIMDYGSEGLKETLHLLKTKKIDFVGAGNIHDEIGVIYKTKNYIKVAIINVCENEWSTEVMDEYYANGFSEIKMFYAITNAKKQGYKVIVIHHGGHEMYNLPSPRLKSTLRYFVDCGADVVVNHHTHCIGGNEVYNNAPIFYSLGNFIFDYGNKRNSIWNYGMGIVLDLSLDSINFETFYFNQFDDDNDVKIIKSIDLLYDLDNLNSIIQDNKALDEKFKEFVNQSKKQYNTYLEPIKSKYLLALINRKLLPSFWHPRKRQYLKNIITCESHYEIVKILLRNEIINAK